MSVRKKPAVDQKAKMLAAINSTPSVWAPSFAATWMANGAVVRLAFGEWTGGEFFVRSSVCMSVQQAAELSALIQSHLLRPVVDEIKRTKGQAA